jgi:hypothetical protein
MAVTPISGAYADNVAIERLGAAIFKTSVGIGAFDGYAVNSAALPAADPALTDKVYFVGDESTPYTCDGATWNAGSIIPVVLGTVFYVVESGKVVQECRYTTKPTYDDPETPTTATGGVCTLLEMGASRALTDAEVDDALAAAGF